MITGFDNLRKFLLTNQLEINKLLRMDKKDWNEIMIKAHDQAVASEKLMDLACEEAQKIEKEKENRPAPIKITHINSKDVSAFLEQMPH